MGYVDGGKNELTDRQVVTKQLKNVYTPPSNSFIKITTSDT